MRHALRKTGQPAPELRIVFNVSDQMPLMKFGNLEITGRDRTASGVPRGFALAFDRWNEAQRCRATFDARIYDPAKVRKFIERYLRFIESITAQPDYPLAHLPGLIQKATGRIDWLREKLKRCTRLDSNQRPPD